MLEKKTEVKKLKSKVKVDGIMQAYEGTIDGLRGRPVPITRPLDCKGITLDMKGSDMTIGKTNI